MKNKVISALVIGRSGTGKSEFIRSLIDEEQREYIITSGEGQTTRSSMEYHILNDEKQDLSIEIQIKTKSEFAEERRQVVEEFFEDEDNEYVIETIKQGFEKKVNYKFNVFRNHLILDDAFFNCEEFGEEVSNIITEEFDKRFSREFWQDKTDVIFQKSGDEQQNDKSDKDFYGKFEEFFKFVYDCCKPKIPLKRSFKPLMVDGDKEKIKEELLQFFRVSDDGRSYSALVKKVVIKTKLSEIYSDVVDKLLLVDTYGLDHADTISKESLKRRYSSLLRHTDPDDDNPDIKTVLYLRNIASKDAPTDLKTGITTLFKVEPSVHPFIIFTFWDAYVKNKSGDITLEKSKAYREIDKIKDEIGAILSSESISEVLIEGRIKELCETRVPYASKYYEDENKEELIQKNRESLRKILCAIRYKTYLGKQVYINIKNLQDKKAMNEVLSVENLFASRDLRCYPNATKGAIRRRIQPEEGRYLGFNSSTQNSVLWSDIIADDLNERFTNENSIKSVQDAMKDVTGATNALAEIFVKFSKALYKGAKDDVDSLYTTNAKCYGIEIIKCLYEDRKDRIGLGYDNVGKYLTDIYRFANIKEETKEKLEKVIDKAFKDVFVPMCRQYNAEKLAECIGEDTTYDERENLFNEYYLEYEDNLTDDEKEEFERMVSDYCY